jgi:hypothetical protein
MVTLFPPLVDALEGAIWGHSIMCRINIAWPHQAKLYLKEQLPGKPCFDWFPWGNKQHDSNTGFWAKRGRW